MKPSSRTLVFALFCVVSIVSYGQNVQLRDVEKPASSSAIDSDVTGIYPITDPAQIDTIESAITGNGDGSVDIQDGISCTILTYYENDGVVPVEKELSLSAVTETQLVSASVHIYYNYKPDQDSLVFGDQSGITGSYDPVQGILELTGTASFSEYTKALASVSYINTSEDPSKDQRRVKFYMNNGTTVKNVNETYINVIPVNDPPVITGSLTVLPYYPGSGAVKIDTMISITDVDDSILVMGRVWMLEDYKPSEDLLSLASQYGLTVSFDPVSSYLRITGEATIKEYEVILSLAAYTNINPDPLPSTRKIFFKVSDGDALSNFFYRIVEIMPKNNPPSIVDENNHTIDTIYVSTEEDTPVQVCLNAIDNDGHVVAVSSVESQTGNGSGDDLEALCFTYTPNKDFNGIDTLTVVACDDGIPSECDTAIVIVEVIPVNDAPQVTNLDVSIDTLYYSTEEDVPLDICLTIVNDDDSPVILTSVNTFTSNGTYDLGSPDDLCFTFAPSKDYFGQEIGQIVVCESSEDGLCASVVLVIDITPVNDAPFAVNDTITMAKNFPFEGNLTDNDFDIEGDNLIVNEMPEANPMHGTVKLNKDGSYIYTPDPEFYGNDLFTYIVCDDGEPSLCASADVVITVEDVPLKVYNAVSPNGDELNDILWIQGIEYFPDNLLSIYDRFNNLVYEVTGYNNASVAWEGQANKGISTRDLPGDTYFYILNLGDGSPLMKGFIMLKKY